MSRTYTSADPSVSVAIVGLAGRFPGAPTLDQFWSNLVEGRESVRRFTDEELSAAGVPASVRNRPEYVGARAVLDGVDRFDSDLFEFTAREADVTDPQHRVFLECAWEAVESAGYDPSRTRVPVGVFAGAALSSYLFHLQAIPGAIDTAGWFRVLLGNDKEHLPAWVSYKLDLRGPSVNVQTACSTSLMAVHLAARSLLQGECDLALAGGVNISVPQQRGYLFQDGGILSPDGHCRAYDASAQGTVPADGVGVVVLKRLDDALRDGDTVRAVIRGSAANNDGARRASFGAPGVDGQSQVIAAALGLAGADPSAISYVEGHGSGTSLGDAIELAALNLVFGGSRPATIALGSVKSNIGHAGAAAGIAGLIKTILALEHEKLPASLHYQPQHANAAMADGPFLVVQTTRPWPRTRAPRLAGVSSFGMGGTNVHLIVEEAPAVPPCPSNHGVQLLTLSARSPEALDEATNRLGAYLHQHRDRPLADMAFTLQVGRKHFNHRRQFVIEEAIDAAAVVSGHDPQRMLTSVCVPGSADPVLLLPGLGEQYVNMGRGLYDTQPVFREEVDRCCEILHREVGVALLPLLYPAGDRRSNPEDSGSSALTGLLSPGTRLAGGGGLTDASSAQLSLFVVELALAALWREWGVGCSALLGYSLGEYTAACIAGVMSLSDALRLVATRAEMIQRLESGAMLAVALPAAALEPLLTPSVSIAAFNGPSLCVVAGAVDPMERFAQRLYERRVLCRWLQLTHAFHSPMMETAGDAVTRVARSLTLRAPQMPYVSNVTGTWMTAADATDPSYWARHMCQPVRFWEGLQTVARSGSRTSLEVGPGQMLTLLATENGAADGDEPAMAIASMRPALDPRDDSFVLMEAVGRLWMSGVNVDWERFSQGRGRRRVPLPTYPFQRRRHWVDGHSATPTNTDLLSGSPSEAACTAAPQRRTVPHARTSASRPYEAPRTVTERTLVNLWQDVLGVEPIGLHDRFPELGGNSLVASHLTLRIQHTFQVSLAIGAVFRYATVGRLATRIEELLLDAIEGATPEGTAAQS